MSAWQAVRATQAETLAKAEAIRATKAEAKTSATLVEVSAERDEKERERNKARQISGFLTSVFQSPDPSRDGHDIRVVELLDVATKQLNALDNQPEQQNLLRTTLAKSYFSLGLANQTIVLREQLRDSYQKSGDVRQLASVLPELANAYRLAARFDDAIEAGKRGLELARKNFGDEHLATLNAIHNLATCYANMRRFPDAIPMFEECVTLKAKLLGAESPDTIATRENLAMCYVFTGKHEKAHAILEDLLSINQRLHGTEHPATITTMGHFGLTLFYMQRLDEAIAVQQKTLEAKRKVLGPEHPSTLMAMYHLGNSHSASGDHSKAVQFFGDVLPLHKKVIGEKNPLTIDNMFNLAACLAADGKTEAAIRQYKETVAVAPKHWQSHNNLGKLLQQTGDNDQAIKAWQRTLELNPGVKNDIPYLLGEELEKNGRHAEALAAYQIALKNEAVVLSSIVSKLATNRDLADDLNGKLTDAESFTLAGRALIEMPDRNNAYPHLAVASNWLQTANKQSPDSPDILTALGLCAYRQENWQQAFDYLTKSAQIDGESIENELCRSMALHQLGQTEQAKSTFEKVIARKTAAPAEEFTAALQHMFREAEMLLKP